MKKLHQRGAWVRVKAETGILTLALHRVRKSRTIRRLAFSARLTDAGSLNDVTDLGPVGLTREPGDSDTFLFKSCLRLENCLC